MGGSVLLPRSGLRPPAGSLDTGRAVAAARPGAEAQKRVRTMGRPRSCGAPGLTLRRGWSRAGANWVRR
jgi:hypothetical protein